MMSVTVSLRRNKTPKQLPTDLLHNACRQAVELGGYKIENKAKIVFVFSRRNDETGAPQENPKTSFVILERTIADNNLVLAQSYL